MSDDPFKPLAAGGAKPKLRVVAGGSEAAIVSPVPDDAPSPPKVHPTLGAPTSTWAYRDAEGRALGYVRRFDSPDGKEFRPVTLHRNAKGALFWKWVLWPEPRPLYQLDRLAARPQAPVVITEGEKSADAASRLLPGYVVMTSPGGSNAAAKADWSLLRGRRVILWPDADAPGAKYAGAVASALASAGAASVATVKPPDSVKAGWDAADAEAEGWTPARAEALITGAAPMGGDAKAASEAGAGEGAAASKPPRRGSASIIAMAKEGGWTFWHDEAEEPYATVPNEGHRENYRLTSKKFDQYIALRTLDAGLTPPSRHVLEEAKLVFGAMALNGPTKKIIRRVGWQNGCWYLDLCDKRWRVVEIGPAGWTILENHDLPTIRSASMLPLAEPVETDENLGSLLYDFINSDDAGRKFSVAWLLQALSPGPYLIGILNGEQGSAKSSTAKWMRNLIDANISPERSPPKEESDLLTSATSGHVLSFGNISHFSDEMSDAFCRVTTGGGLGARAKYSNGEEFVFYVKNPLLLNGITAFPRRPDLASRSVVINLKPIDRAARKTETEIADRWAAVAPRALGALLAVAAEALRRLPETTLDSKSRMADFELLMEAASPALGWNPGEFAALYHANIDDLDAATIEDDSVAGAIVRFLKQDEPEGWTGEASILLDRLGAKVSDSVRNSREWPRTPISFGSRLARLAPVMRNQGISIEKRHSGRRTISLIPISQKAPPLGGEDGA